jgi:hypothetical protein
MRAVVLVGLAVWVSALAPPLLGHHSTAAYDTTTLITFTGEVTKLDWRNPHVRIYLDVSDRAHGTVHWDVETWGISQLSVRGLTNGFLKPGDHIRIDVFCAKDHTPHALVHTLTLPDGSRVDGPPVDIPDTR